MLCTKDIKCGKNVRHHVESTIEHTNAAELDEPRVDRSFGSSVLSGKIFWRHASIERLQ
jgi:hypothetical protein